MYDKFVIMFCIGMIQKNIMGSVTYIASRSPSTDDLISQASKIYKTVVLLLCNFKWQFREQ